MFLPPGKWVVRGVPVLAERKKVTSIRTYHRFAWLNIGTILFGAIFIYMVITLFSYLTAKHTASYEVTTGTISGNYRYTALALKNETVIPAPYSGYVTYYARDGARISADATVCAIDEQLSTSALVTEPSSASTDVLSASDRNELREELFAYSQNYSGSTFGEVYNLKANLQSILLNSRSVRASTAGGLVNLVNAPVSGFVVYSIDGMESLTEENITADSFSKNQYRPVNVRLTSDYVHSGDQLFKLITGETWYLYFPLSSDLKLRLQDRSTVRFRFLKDDTTFSASFAVVENDGGSYGRITLKNSLVRYADDRYLEIELLMDSKKGLKIPSSAITERVFYRIPEEYVITNPDHSGEITFLRETYRSNGEAVVNYVTASVYAKQDGGYLVDTALLKEGDYIQMPGTSKRHKVTQGNLVTIQGVYNINQGYAQFRQVTVIDSNEEFCVVEPYSSYGLAAHDFIALNASEVVADEII